MSVEHDEKPPQPKFGGNQFMGARDMTAWIPNSPKKVSEISLVPYIYEPGQFTLLSMRLIRYSRSYILGPHETIHVKLACEGGSYVLLKYGNENAEMQKRKFDDLTLRYSIVWATLV